MTSRGMAGAGADRADAIEVIGANFGYLRFPLEKWLDEMVALRFTSVELWAASPHLYVGDASPAEVRHVRQEIEKRRLNLRCFTPEQVSYPINLAARETAIRERSENYFRRAIQVCAALESPVLLITAGWGYAEEKKEDVLERAVESLRALVEHAERQGVVLALEPLQPFESSIVNTAADLEDLLLRVDLPQLAVVLDTVAMAVAKDTVADYLGRFGTRMRHCHFVDGTPSGHLAWPDGTLPMRQYLSDLVDGGYRGAISVEILNRRYWSHPTQPLSRCRDLIVEALTELGQAQASS